MSEPTLQHVCYTELKFKHSPAVRLAMLKERWRVMQDSDVYLEIAELAEDFAKSSPNSEGWWYHNILTQCKIKIPRTKMVKCYKCGEELTVLP